jgi:hypothetical protein
VNLGKQRKESLDARFFELRGYSLLVPSDGVNRVPFWFLG